MAKLNSKDALRMFGGARKAKEVAGRISKAHGVSLEILTHTNDENPSDNFLNAVFEYDAAMAKDYERARAELVEYLWTRDLGISHECDGDGASGIVVSYRIV